nr:hypothetical protein Iba_chr03cCG5200 [Ipomoea batatas]
MQAQGYEGYFEQAVRSIAYTFKVWRQGGTRHGYTAIVSEDAQDVATWIRSEAYLYYSPQPKRGAAAIEVSFHHQRPHDGVRQSGERELTLHGGSVLGLSLATPGQKSQEVSSNCDVGID